jgi:A/G-specific adenine glycosylase
MPTAVYFIEMVSLPAAKLLNWYAAHKRDLPWRRSKDIYAVWLSEVMLQQTQVNTVIPYYERFLERFPGIAALAAGREQEVLKLWEGLGYYSRVRNFHRAAKEVVDHRGGIIPTDPETFAKLPGVGPYITAAVMSIACGVPMAAVDGNVMRVYTRFKGIADDTGKSATRKRVTEELTQVIPTAAAGDFTQAFMELGALVCTPKSPRCGECPFRAQCAAFNSGTVEKYPVKAKRAKVPEYNVSVAIVVDGDRFYIQERPSKGHLGGMWEFPGGKSEAGETPEHTLLRECKEELGVGIGILKKLAVVHHAYSHFKIHMSVFICRLIGETINQPEGRPFRWITVEQLEDYPFPGANHKFFPRLRDYFRV